MIGTAGMATNFEFVTRTLDKNEERKVRFPSIPSKILQLHNEDPADFHRLLSFNRAKPDSAHRMPGSVRYQHQHTL